MTEGTTPRGPSGIPVDSTGGPTIDPTKNVLDLVKAAVERLDDLFDAVVKRLDERVDHLSGRIDAEADKSNAIRSQRDYYETRMDHMRSDFQKQFAAAQERNADKEAQGLSEAVNKATERLAQVEKNQYISGGATAVRDPATAEALVKISATLAELSAKGSQSEGRSKGLSEAGAILLGAASIIVSIIVVAGFIIARTN